MRSSTRLLVSTFATLTLTSAGCGGADSPTPLTPDPPAENDQPVSISVSPASDSVAAGDTLQLTIAAVDRRGRTTTNARVVWATTNTAVATVSQTGLVVGVGGGAAIVTATSGSVAGRASLTVVASTGPGGPGTPSEPPAPVAPGTPPPRPTTPITPVEGPWTFCANAGAPCNFVGLRDVRLGGPNGPYVVQTEYSGVPCAVYGFNDRNPAPGQDLHCDYGPLRTATLTNPMPGTAGLGETVTVPYGSPGASDPRVQGGAPEGISADGSGSFRTTCGLAGYAFADPISHPNQPGASYLHVFFGNTGVTASSTPESVAGSGNSTCRGGTLNRTSYWMPAVFDTRTGDAVTPVDALLYYQTGYNVDPTVVRPMPVGLRMIVGDKNATGAQEHIGWTCRDNPGARSGMIPATCPVGDAVRLTLIFPQCWDGVNLDSPDHKRHLAYPDYRSATRSSCPPSHPVTLPAITEHFDFPVTDAAAPRYWRLSSDVYSAATRGGLSAHADWMNGWDPATMNTIVTQCLNKALDCGIGSIGNGQALY